MKRTTVIAALWTSLLLATGPLSAADEAPAAAPAAKKNVLLIISDDLTTTALGCYGQPLRLLAEYRYVCRQAACGSTMRIASIRCAIRAAVRS